MVKTIATHLALMFALVMLSIHVSDLHANAKAKAFLVMVIVMVIVTAVTNAKTRIEKKMPMTQQILGLSALDKVTT